MTEAGKLKHAILAILPEHLAKDVKDNLDATIQGSLSKMNLVSRDEFLVLQKVLLKTRAKVDALEQTLAELEQYSAS